MTLLKAGGDACWKNKDGKTPFEVVPKGKKHNEVRKTLMMAMEKEKNSGETKESGKRRNREEEFS